jgi:hypothetical protein
VTQTQAASSVTYTSIQAPSYYTVTTSIDALTLTTVLAAPTQFITESLAGSNVTITQTLPGNTQYVTSITSLPAYTTTLTLAASTQVLTSYQAASYYTVTTSVEALTVTSIISAPVQTITATQAASTQFVTRTESQAASTFYETTTISLDAITRTRTETSIGLTVSSFETTVTGEFRDIPCKHIPSTLFSKSDVYAFERVGKRLSVLNAFLAHASRIILKQKATPMRCATIFSKAPPGMCYS